MTAAAAIAGPGIAAPPSAAASVDLAVGMPIQIGKHRCSLGFFGYNRRGDRLAVTAGHCSDSVDQYVTSESGTKIGEVVSRLPDNEDGHGRLTGSRGYTLFLVYKRLSLQRFFTDTSRSVAVGDSVSKFGERTGKTRGHITEVSAAARPDLALISSDMVQISGDSGCPWYTSGPTLIGIASSGDEADRGATAGSQAQPLGAVIDLIRTKPTVWREDFKVWIE
ncbi:hypothetical protein AWC17_25160 [Mycobacterium nebraskense]|uniref:Peptidase S1 domain-containing protein n=2 Tax=Mycobacterium nebraskense TaxID=244292 RepID=A0A1X1ZZ73_9MYCO|nr:hypothetical protein AWC17_25160 [Mycobacterium nebraskense]